MNRSPEDRNEVPALRVGDGIGRQMQERRSRERERETRYGERCRTMYGFYGDYLMFFSSSMAMDGGIRRNGGQWQDDGGKRIIDRA